MFCRIYNCKKDLLNYKVKNVTKKAILVDYTQYNYLLNDEDVNIISLQTEITKSAGENL